MDDKRFKLWCCVAPACLALLLSVIIPAVPIGHYWWDWMSFLGVAAAGRQGLTPFVDYWTTLSFPIWQAQFAVSIVGYGRAFLFLHATQLSIALFGLYLVGQPRLSKGLFFLASAMTVAMAFLPFNYSHVGTSTIDGNAGYLGTIHFNDFYTRFAGSLIFISSIMSIPRKNENSEIYHDTIFSTMYLMISFFLKMSCFYIAIVCLFIAAAVNADDRRLIKSVLTASIITVISLGLVEISTGMISKYNQIINDVAKYKVERIRDEYRFRIGGFLRFHKMDMLLVLVLAVPGLGMLVPAALRCLTRYQTLASMCKGERPALIMANAVALSAGIVLFTLTNWGDQGLIPAFFIVAIAGLHCLFSDRPATEPASSGDVHHLRWLESAGLKVIGAISTLISAGYLLYLFTSFAYLLQGYVSHRYEHLDTSAPMLDQAFLMERSVARRAAVITPEIMARAQYGFVFEPEDFVFKARSFGQLYQWLHERYGDEKMPAVLLSLPAFALAPIAGMLVPPQAYSWMLVNHEIDKDHPPDTSAILANASLVVNDLCEPDEANRDNIFNVFKPTLDAEFRYIGRRGCWRLFERVLR